MVFAGPCRNRKDLYRRCLAIKALKEKQVKRIIFTRPAVEAGENLVFFHDMKEN
jgi:phosphate starvation-inducible PhoH-like protein